MYTSLRYMGTISFYANVSEMFCFYRLFLFDYVFNDLFHRLIKRFNESLIKSEMSIPEVKWGYELATFLEMTV